MREYSILLQIKQVIDLTTPYWSAFWAACVVSCFSFLRKSNLFQNSCNNHYLKCNQVIVNHKGQVLLCISSTKTIQFQQRKLILPLPHIPGHPLCPVSALVHLFKINVAVCDPDSPVFVYRCSQGVEPLSYTCFIKDLKIVLHKIGISQNQFSGHSFRRGGAFYVLQIGIPGDIINFISWQR